MQYEFTTKVLAKVVSKSAHQRQVIVLKLLTSSKSVDQKMFSGKG